MSSRSDEDFSCPVCHDVFRDPVVLSCSHSFCKACLQQWWSEKRERLCPCCKRRSSKSDPPRNLALKNLCEARSQEGDRRGSAGSEDLCSLHAEKLRLFCLDHKETVCLVCRDSKRHKDHRFRPVDEAAQDQREELQKVLRPLRDKRSLFEQVKEDCDQTAKHIKVQAGQTERQMKEQFEKLHRFLREEEEARLGALREEEELKSRTMKEKTEALGREIAALSHAVRAAEEEMRAEDVSFLLNYPAAEERLRQRPLPDDPQPLSGALIDVAKHLGNLTYNIWNKMKEVVSYAPVILDPNTADPELVVSGDLSRVRSAERRQLPKNPERNKFSCSVLGSQGFSSGTHSWDVDTGDNEDWEVGVLGEHIRTDARPPSGLWRILFSEGKLTAFSTSGSEQDLSPRKKPRRIRVHLDFDGGKLTFHDLDADTLVHTFKHTFTDTLFPYMYTESRLWLRILPVKVGVKVRRNP
uniref:Tripartite motif-containing protein 35-like n=1 Tax=Scophthalmus maximus TaxID=52904 RepID=A0A8D2ZNK6_SCOMX